MKVLNGVKFVSGAVISSGVGTIVGNVVGATSPEDMTKFTKVCVTAGAAALGALMGSMTVEHINGEIDEISESFKTIKEELSSSSEEA